MSDQKQEESKKLTAIEEKIRAFNKGCPVGSAIRYTDKKDIMHKTTLAGSAREVDKNIFVQVSGVADLVSMDKVQPAA